MAKKWINKNLPGALHFVTGNVNKRQPIFQQEASCLAFLEELQNLRAKHKRRIIAFVLMPDHIHFIANPHDGKIREFTGGLKSSAARRLIELAPEKFIKNENENQVWQESFKALPLWSNWMIWQKINYIHNNPLKAKLCNSVKDYRWSSFRSFYKMDCEELLQVDQDWWQEDDVRKLSESMAEWNDETAEKYKK